MSEPEASTKPFDFTEHKQAAVSEYLKVQSFYGDFASVIARILEECLKRREIKVLSVQHRAKAPTSVAAKAAIPSEAEPNKPKYPEPLKQITDLAGVRIIAYFPGTLADINRLLHEELTIVEQFNKGEELIEEERFGYQSIHYLVRIKPDRARLAEYGRFSDAVAEVQVRTILQHAWAEIEHDIQYKSSTAIPTEIRRRFMALAGMLEIADREFQAINDQDRQLADKTRGMVSRGDLGGVEITPDALKLFLDKKLGSDGRISDWSYDWNARLLKRLGFRDLKQVETAITPYSDDQLSTLAMDGRQGQTTRFELMLLAALGERFLERHPFKGQPWFGERQRRYLSTFRERGIKTSVYDPIEAPEVSATSQP